MLKAMELKATGMDPTSEVTDRKREAQDRLYNAATKAWLEQGGDPKLLAPSWNEFIQTTTIHGVKHIFDPSPFKLRR